MAVPGRGLHPTTSLNKSCVVHHNKKWSIMSARGRTATASVRIDYHAMSASPRKRQRHSSRYDPSVRAKFRELAALGYFKLPAIVILESTEERLAVLRKNRRHDEGLPDSLFVPRPAEHAGAFGSGRAVFVHRAGEAGAGEPSAEEDPGACPGGARRTEPQPWEALSIDRHVLIPPEQLLSALLLQVFYGIRSERQLMEQLDYNLLYRWFVGLSPDDPVWDPTTFTKNRDRLQNGAVFAKFMDAF